MTKKGCGTWRAIVTRDPCVYCVAWATNYRGNDAMTVEHVTPKAHGGSHTSWENLVGAHQSCNHDRGQMPLLRYLVLKHRLTIVRGRKNHWARARLRRAFGAGTPPRDLSGRGRV